MTIGQFKKKKKSQFKPNTKSCLFYRKKNNVLLSTQEL